MSEAPSLSTDNRILVVDDSPTVLRVVEAVLVQAGYEVMCLDSGREVVEAARRMRPSLIIVDFAMPEMNGFAVCRALGSNPDTHNIPIVLMNTRGDAVADRFVLEFGVVDHITKPFAPEALLALVEHVLEKPVAPRRCEPPPSPELTSPEPEPDETATVALNGDLAVVPVAEVLQLLSLQRQTGALIVTRGDAKVSIFLKQGQVRLVTGTRVSPELLLGNILVSEKLVTAEDLERLLANRRGTRRLLGTQIVQLGYISRDDLHRALRRQSSELIYELLRWHHGQFSFERRERLAPEVLEFEFGVTIDFLLMEGFRRVDEWGLIESVLSSFDVVPSVVPGGVEHLGTTDLTAEEKAVLAVIDGTRNVREIISVIGMPAFEVARLIYRLVSTRVIIVPSTLVPE